MNSRRLRARAAIPMLLTLGWGLILLFILWPNGGPFSGFDMAFSGEDINEHYVAATAAMYDPIDWAHPLAISALLFPTGTSLLLADTLPLLVLPLRILWQAGLQIDPAVALDLWVALMCVIAPFSVYRLTRALGGSGGAGLLVAVLALANPTLRLWIDSSSGSGAPYGSQGLASWPLLVLLIAEFVTLTHTRTHRLIVTAIVSGLLWWTNPYLGLMGAAVVAIYSAQALLLRNTRLLLPLIGSLLGLALVNQASIEIKSGLSIERHHAALSIIPGLLPGDMSLVYPQVWWLWDAAAVLPFLLVLPLLWRRYRVLAISSLLLALLSLGSSSEFSGGLLPPELFLGTPLSLLWAFDRLFFLPALLGFCLLAVMIGDRIRERRRLTALLLCLPVLFALWSWSPRLIREIGGEPPRVLFPSPTNVIHAAPGEEVRSLGAVNALIARHRTLLFLPDISPGCGALPEAVPYDTYAHVAGQKMGFALLAIKQRLPVYSFYVARRIYRTDDGSPGNPDGYACAHERIHPSSGTLVVASLSMEPYTNLATPWRNVVAGMARCTDSIAIGLISDVRFCSDDVSAIESFEAEIAAIKADDQ